MLLRAPDLDELPGKTPMDRAVRGAAGLLSSSELAKCPLCTGRRDPESYGG
jgi:hypothetical protein